MVASGDFPVIDIAALQRPEVPAAARSEIARRIASACQEIGFFAVTGHGVPRAVIADLVAQSYAFFDLPLAEKLAVRRPRPEQNRGYIRAGRGAPGAAARRRDTAGSEGALHDRPLRPAAAPYFTGPAAYPSFAPNLWPARPAGLRSALASLLARTRPGRAGSVPDLCRGARSAGRISSTTRSTSTSASCGSCITRRRRPRRCPGNCAQGRTATSA